MYVALMCHNSGNRLRFLSDENQIHSHSSPLRFVVGKVALHQICGGQSGTAPDLWWAKWHCTRFVVGLVALHQICGGLSGTAPDLWWAKWHCTGFVSQQEQRVKDQQHLNTQPILSY